MNTLRLQGYALFIGVICASSVSPSLAEKIDQKSLEKAKFYEAPRQFQILDERPIIHDFREAPQAAQQIELPAGPQGGGGASGGSGAGALGGGAPSLPSGGLQLGGGRDPGYRTTPSQSLPLPKSGFQGSNIPARGMGPAGVLPGVTQGVVGKMMAQQKPAATGAGPAHGMAPPRGRTTGTTPAAPTVASYGGYGQGSGAGLGNSSRTDANVHGYLLKKH
jgi:hypothetical protein